MSKLRVAATALAFVSLASCEAAPLTAPDGSSFFLQANPTFVIANGGISVVTAVITEPAGTFVADGIEVYFFTDLGRVDQVGKTVNGIARVNFVSDSRSGTATITALSGQKAGAAPPTVKVAVGNALPSRVLVAADPARIVAPRNSSITATVFDVNGNPVQNVPVSFSISATPLEERLDSGGALLYTNSNGQVFDVLRTQAPIGIVQKRVTVTATTANGVTASTIVSVD